MRIAVFSDTYLPQVNGVSKTLHLMHRYMNQAGIESLFVTPTAPEGEEGILTLPGLKFFMYPELSLALPRYFYTRRIMDEFKPDIIHLATEYTVGLIGLKYALSRGCLLSASYHTNIPEYLGYYNMPTLEGIAWKYLLWFHSYMHINMCPSDATAQLLSQRGMGNLQVMGRGIDEEGFSPLMRSEEIRRAWDIPGECLVLLYVGRLAVEKELDVLLEATQYLGDRPFRLMMVGDGPLRSELEKRRDEKILFTGYKTGEELRRIYASADIFAFPSSTETYGNVILEAMASGLPVVGPQAGGVQENIIDGYNGLYFTPHQAADMAQAIIKLMDDENLRLQTGRNAYQHAQSRTWQNEFCQVFETYQQMLEKPSSDPIGMLSAS
jgi:glycosyltransferase involved in cell wall biosynthesis